MRLFDLIRRRDFKLPEFEPIQLEFEPESDELLLDAIVTGLGPESQVVRLVQPMPTAGELQAKIDDHLRGSPASTPAMTAADELRNALAELKQSVG